MRAVEKWELELQKTKNQIARNVLKQNKRLVQRIVMNAIAPGKGKHESMKEFRKRDPLVARYLTDAPFAAEVDKHHARVTGTETTSTRSRPQHRFASVLVVILMNLWRILTGARSWVWGRLP